jgi:microcystin-dependent protein
MKTLRFLTILATLALSYNLPAQVGINTTTPDSTAALHIHHLTKGVLLPTVDASVRANIVSATDVANGLLVYDTLQKLYYYRDPESKNWIVLNPVRVSEQPGAPWGDVRLAGSYRQRNVYIGANDAATAQAKLHVGGTFMADGAVTAKNGMDITGNTAVTGNMSVSSSFTVGSNITATAGTVTATNFVGFGTIPLGGIIMWSGTTIPNGWALCDGQSSNGYKTPDLRGRFIVGYGTNGTNVPTNAWDNTYNQPGNLSQKGTIAGTTGGEKTHTLTIAEMPRHRHYSRNGAEGDGGSSGKYLSPHAVDADLSGSASDIGVEEGQAGPTGNTGGSQAHENRPPYYVLAFIMRVK